jgi:hypothetical protein
MLFVVYIIVLPFVFTNDIELSFIERSCALNKKNVLIKSWVNITKYPFLKWQWIVSLLRKYFLSSIADNIFRGLDTSCQILTLAALMLLEY